MFNHISKLLHSDGHIESGKGMVSGVIALGLAVLSCMGVLAFHFPEYLTMPELRQSYSVPFLRTVLMAALSVSGLISIANILLNRVRWLSLWAFGLVVVALLMGGHTVPVDDIASHTPYVGLDWLILDLLGSTIIFVFLEKMFALRKKQSVFRAEWQTDLAYFGLNHLLVGFMLLAVNFAVHHIFGWAVKSQLQTWIQGLPFVIELFLIVLLADFMQYWTHRAYHEVPFLWRFHAVHHSVKSMDWLAGSRLHAFEIIFTRICVLGPIFIMGFSKEVIDAYIVIIGFQAVFNHANVSCRLGLLRYVLVTPNFHHWHHSQDAEAIDKNYAANFAFLDYLFGTAVKSDREWPTEYGVVGDYVPRGIWAQLRFPFKKNPWGEKPR